jgi:hypothetical protein
VGGDQGTLLERSDAKMQREQPQPKGRPPSTQRHEEHRDSSTRTKDEDEHEASSRLRRIWDIAVQRGQGLGAGSTGRRWRWRMAPRAGGSVAACDQVGVSGHKGRDPGPWGHCPGSGGGCAGRGTSLGKGLPRPAGKPRAGWRCLIVVSSTVQMCPC